jgi:DNA-binding NtrC family response regulator
LHPDVQGRLRRYPWPGNLRELENVLERAYILEIGEVLMPERFPVAIMADPSRMYQSRVHWDELPLSQARQMAVDQFESSYLVNLLKKHKGRINSAAEAAGITPRQLNRLVSRHALDKRDYRS